VARRDNDKLRRIVRLDDGAGTHGWQLRIPAWASLRCASTAAAWLPTVLTAALSCAGVTPNFRDQSRTS
jgi:hypothetical protein